MHGFNFFWHIFKEYQTKFIPKILDVHSISLYIVYYAILNFLQPWKA